MRSRRTVVRTEAVVLGALVGLIILFSTLAMNRFATVSNFRSLALDSSLLLVLAVGQTFVIITGNVDLSVGSTLVLSNVVATKVMSGNNGVWWIVLGLVVCVAVGLIGGAINGAVVAKARLSPLIVTLATLSIYLGLANLLTDGLNLRDVPSALTTGFAYRDVLGVPLLFGVGAGVALTGGLILRMTVFGRHTYAVGSNAASALRAGIRVDRQIVSVFTLAGAMSGLAGFLAISRFGTTSLGGHSTDNIQVITAVALGGVSLYGGAGTMLGSVVGVSIPVVLQNGLVIVGVAPYWQQVTIGLVLLLAVFVDRRRRLTTT